MWEADGGKGGVRLKINEERGANVCKRVGKKCIKTCYQQLISILRSGTYLPVVYIKYTVHGGQKWWWIVVPTKYRF